MTELLFNYKLENKQILEQISFGEKNYSFLGEALFNQTLDQLLLSGFTNFYSYTENNIDFSMAVDNEFLYYAKEFFLDHDFMYRRFKLLTYDLKLDEYDYEFFDDMIYNYFAAIAIETNNDKDILLLCLNHFLAPFYYIDCDLKMDDKYMEILKSYFKYYYDEKIKVELNVDTEGLLATITIPYVERVFSNYSYDFSSAILNCYKEAYHYLLDNRIIPDYERACDHLPNYCKKLEYLYQNHYIGKIHYDFDNYDDWHCTISIEGLKFKCTAVKNKKVHAKNEAAKLIFNTISHPELHYDTLNYEDDFSFFDDELPF